MLDMPIELLNEANKLTTQEKKELIKRIVNTMDGSDIKDLVNEIHIIIETMSLLKAIEPAFEDWINEKDAAYSIRK
jgi:hypothetical protein